MDEFASAKPVFDEIFQSVQRREHPLVMCRRSLMQNPYFCGINIDALAESLVDASREFFDALKRDNPEGFARLAVCPFCGDVMCPQYVMPMYPLESFFI